MTETTQRKNIGIRLSVEAHQRLAIAALKRRTKIQPLVVAAIEAYLAGPAEVAEPARPSAHSKALALYDEFLQVADPAVRRLVENQIAATVQIAAAAVEAETVRRHKRPRSA